MRRNVAEGARRTTQLGAHLFLVPDGELDQANDVDVEVHGVALSEALEALSAT